MDEWYSRLPSKLQGLIRDAEDQAWPFIPEEWQFELNARKESINVKDLILSRNASLPEMMEKDVLKECLEQACSSEAYQTAAAVAFLLDRFMYWYGNSQYILDKVDFIRHAAPTTPIAPQLIIRKARVLKDDGSLQKAEKTLDFILTDKRHREQWQYKEESQYDLVRATCVQIKGVIRHNLGLWLDAADLILESILRYNSLPKPDLKGIGSSLGVLSDILRNISTQDFRLLLSKYEVRYEHPLMEAYAANRQAAWLARFEPFFHARHQRRAGEVLLMYVVNLPPLERPPLVSQALEDLKMSLKSHTSLTALRSKEQLYEFTCALYQTVIAYCLLATEGHIETGVAIEKFCMVIYDHYCSSTGNVQLGDDIVGTVNGVLKLLGIPTLSEEANDSNLLDLPPYQYQYPALRRGGHSTGGSSEYLYARGSKAEGLGQGAGSQNPPNSGSSGAKNERESSEATGAGDRELTEDDVADPGATTRLRSKDAASVPDIADASATTESPVQMSDDVVKRDGSEGKENSKPKSDEVKTSEDQDIRSSNENASGALEEIVDDSVPEFADASATTEPPVLSISQESGGSNAQTDGKKGDGGEANKIQDTKSSGANGSGDLAEICEESVPELADASATTEGPVENTNDSPNTAGSVFSEGERIDQSRSVQVSHENKSSKIPAAFGNVPNKADDITSESIPEIADEGATTFESGAGNMAAGNDVSLDEDVVPDAASVETGYGGSLEGAAGPSGAEGGPEEDCDESESVAPDPDLSDNFNLVPSTFLQADRTNPISSFTDVSLPANEEGVQALEGDQLRDVQMPPIEEVCKKLGDLQLEPLEVHRARVFKYDPAQRIWTCLTTLVFVDEELAVGRKGAMRDVIKLQYLNQDEPRARYVGKTYRKPEDKKKLKKYYQDVLGQMTARHYVALFNQMLRDNPQGWQVQFVPAAHAQLLSKDGEEILDAFNVEPYVEGSAFVKVTNNDKYINNKLDRNLLDVSLAFMHFSFDHSGGVLMVTDLQGWLPQDQAGTIIFTDPAIHSVKLKCFETGNRGRIGFNAFWQHQHPKCNAICRSLGLKRPST